MRKILARQPLLNRRATARRRFFIPARGARPRTIAWPLLRFLTFVQPLFLAHVLSPTWAWQLHSEWERGPSDRGPSDLDTCAARCVQTCWTAQPCRITELFLLALLPDHESNCGHFIAARYKFDSTSAITIWDSLKGDSTSRSGTNFLSDTYVALRAAL